MKIHKPQTKQILPRIKIVGIGGGGINAVNHMITCGMQGVDFIAVDTDEQQLLLSKAQNCLRIGEKLCSGLDANEQPEFGKKAAEASRDILIEQLRDADMVFITASMGGNTGSSAASIVAEYAKKVGALTVGVVTKPFSFESKRRMNKAETGIVMLKDSADAVITIPFDQLSKIINRKTSVQESFRFADDMMRLGIQGITDLFIPNLINAEFWDVKTVLENAGSAWLGIGTAKGKNGAQAATEAAIKSPLLGSPIIGALGVLFNITGGEEMCLENVVDAANIITEAVEPNANIVFGTILDNKLAKDEFRVTVVAVRCQNYTEREVCANCKGTYFKGDKYCRYCGAPMGEPEYIVEILPVLYGPPVKRFHTCANCGYTWYSIGPIDKGRYCPQCGGDSPVSSIDNTWWKK